MASPAAWVGGARPRTLPAALAPVAVGSGVAAHLDSFGLGGPLGPAGCGGVPGGGQLPQRLQRRRERDRRSSGRSGGWSVRGLATARSVKSAAIGAFVVGAVAGLALTVLSQQWWLVPAGIASVLAGWFYTGGPRPYGYAGFGELFVFVFFGLVAVVGTAAAQIGSITWLAVVASVPVGLWACAILIANNLRDIPTDTEAGKNTLAVRLGDRHYPTLFVAVVIVGFLIVPQWSS